MTAIAGNPKYWRVVEDCLVKFHGYDPLEAAKLVDGLRERLSAKLPTDDRSIVYHAEPVDVACDLAGVPLARAAYNAAYLKLLGLAPVSGASASPLNTPEIGAGRARVAVTAPIQRRSAPDEFGRRRDSGRRQAATILWGAIAVGAVVCIAIGLAWLATASIAWLGIDPTLVMYLTLSVIAVVAFMARRQLWHWSKRRFMRWLGRRR